jgi:hypothetical protein
MARREGEGIYRRIAIRMHGDEKVRKLSKPPPSGKGLWYELLIGEQTGIIPGLFKIGEAAFAEQLEWPICADESKGISKGFREAFAEAVDQGMVRADWKVRLVFVPNAVAHNFPQSPNVILHWRVAWDLLPECELKLEAWQHIRALFKSEGEAWVKAFEKACPKPFEKASPNQGSGNRDQVAGETASSAAPTPVGQPLPLQVAESDAHRVFEEWRRVMGKTAAAKFTPEREKNVRARLKDGYTVDRLFKAIRGNKLSPHHQGQNETGTIYDDLELICRDGKRVEMFEAIADRPPTPPVKNGGPARAGGLIPASTHEEHAAEARAEAERRGRT